MLEQGQPVTSTAGGAEETGLIEGSVLPFLLLYVQ